MKIEYPSELANAAAHLGVDIGTGIDIDGRSALLDLDARIHGEEVSFGFFGPFKKITKKVRAKVNVNLAAQARTPAQQQAVDKLAKAPLKFDAKGTAAGLAKGLGTGAAIASFVIPGAGPLVGGGLIAGMAAADKVLSDPRIKNAKDVIKNTQALAALGDKGAQRGVAVLSAVAQIRTAKQAAPGKSVIPAQAVNINAYVAKRSPAQVKALATKKIVAMKKKGTWERFLNWIGLAPAVAAKGK